LADCSELANQARRAQDASMPRFDNLSSEELENIRLMIEEFDSIEAIDDDMRELVEKHWPWLLEKLPPQSQQ
jgi:AMMECR1 domain-containing protein